MINDNKILKDIENLINEKNKEIERLRGENITNQKWFLKLIFNLRYNLITSYKQKMKKQSYIKYSKVMKWTNDIKKELKGGLRK